MTFEIGLTFTGTVSAGAYTGGVIDFIIDMLDEWEKEKAANRAKYGGELDKWQVPWHDVVIKGLSGASGGGGYGLWNRDGGRRRIAAASN